MPAQTRRQREVLDFISKFIDSHGYRPSYQLIARKLGVNSRGGIARIVKDLEAQGLLQRRHENGHFYLDVASNTPSEAGALMIQWLQLVRRDPNEGEAPEPFPVPAFILPEGPADRFRAFRIRDDAMLQEHICQGDIVLVELRGFVRDGQTVLVIVDEAPILRKYFRAGPEVELRYSDDMVAVSLSADRIEIVGIYRGLLRPFA